MNGLEALLRRLSRELADLDVGWALIGGLAVSVHAEPRTTTDIDVALAVPSDTGAEDVVRHLTARGFHIAEHGVLENVATGRLATVRLLAPEALDQQVVADLMFDSSGIEREIVESAQDIEVFEGVRVRVVDRGHLLALKLLAGRAQDIADASALLEHSSDEDLARARRAAELITARGCHRGRDIVDLLKRLRRGEAIELL